jgi:hypothetical protein
VTFQDENVDDTTQSQPGGIYKTIRPDSDVELNQWFKRPRVIHTYAWAEGTNYAVNLNPYYLYFTLPTVLPKLAGYSRMRCKMHLKFVLNATSFQYGCVYATIKPLISANLGSELYDYSGGNTHDMNLIQLSTRPGAFISVNNKAGADFSIPFIYHKEWIDLTNEVVQPGLIQPYSELSSAAKLKVSPVTPLLTSSPTIGPSVDVTLYAWLDDIELDGPTSYQSDTVSRLRESKVISRTADTVGKYSAALATVNPLFAPLALASEITSNVAKFFGFTNRPVTSSVVAFRPDPIPNLCSPEISTQYDKLGLDPTNELSVDPSVCGAEMNDPLIISNIVSRPSLIGVSNWTVDAAPGSMLFESYVTPSFATVSAPITSGSTRLFKRVSPSTLAGASMFYNKWRGGITYKFRVICSPFHSGRVRLIWDPSYYAESSGLDGMVHTEIHDICADLEFEFTPPYLGSAAWKQIEKSYLVSPTTYKGNYNFAGGSGLNPFIGNDDTANGYVRLEVLNSLSAPDTSADVKICVWVSGGPDFELNDPTDIPVHSGAGYSFYPTTTDYNALQSDTISRPSNSSSPAKVADMNPNSLVDTAGDYRVYMGEPVRSLRQLLHRSHFVGTIPLGLAGTSTFHTIINEARRPTTPGPLSVTNLSTPVATSTSGATTSPFRFCPLTPLAFYTSAFVGWRGSFVKRITAPDNGKSSVDTIAITRDTGTYQQDITTNDTSTWTPLQRATINAVELPSSSGQSVCLARTSAAAAAVVPMYSRRLVLPGNLNFEERKVPGAGNYVFGYENDNVKTVIESTGPAFNTSFYEAAGPDYTVCQFLNFPDISILAADPSLP